MSFAATATTRSSSSRLDARRTFRPMIDWSGLDAAIAGDVVQPSDPDWDAARQAWNLAADQHPAVVAHAAARADLAATVRFAGANGLRVAPQSTGHGAPVLGDLSDAILLRTGGLTGVAVDPGARTARVQSGTPWRQVVETAGEHGLACLHGMSGGVGVAGYTLGGGVGWLARREGFSSTHVRSFDVVTADGEERHVDADHEPDLFWALRGAGGGQFGVVTSLVFDPVSAPETTRFVLTWPGTDAAAVISAWQEFAPDAPDDVNANLKVIAGGDVIMFGMGSPDLPVPTPASRTVTTLPYRELKDSFGDLDPAEPGPVVSKSEFFSRSLPPEAIVALLETLGRGHRELNFTPMGGAYNRVPAIATAFVHRTERFMLEHVSNDAEWTRNSWEIAHPYGSGRVYPNFPDPELDDWPAAYHGENYARLVAVKWHYDPEHMLRFPQSL
jgi:FAD/FMN-containing dehydrogenase